MAGKGGEKKNPKKRYEREGGERVITHTKKVPEMVSVTISGKKTKEIEQAIRLVLHKENRKRKAEGKKRLPYLIVTLPERRQCHRSQRPHEDHPQR
jgi:hypothetical protein